MGNANCAACNTCNKDLEVPQELQTDIVSDKENIFCVNSRIYKSLFFRILGCT